jgi:hypothetical protein
LEQEDRHENDGGEQEGKSVRAQDMSPEDHHGSNVHRGNA